MTRSLWLPDVLRDAGLDVRTEPGWERRGAPFVDLHSLVWHHDGSGVGYSPGVPAYMAREIDAGRAGAQLWVDFFGRWVVVASGVVSHTGAVLPGKPGNNRALGVETDHTTGEPWSGVHMLHSLRHGTAAILRHLDQNEGRLEFHKTICSPVGRKQDPDGLELATEREAVRYLLLTPEDDMEYKDWSPASKMMLAADVTNVMMGALAEDTKFTAADRLRKAAARADRAADLLEAK